jgi:hypothetical protein
MRILILAFLFPISLFSQDSKFVFGLQGGLGHSKIAFPDIRSDIQDKPILGYAGGIALQYNFYKFLSIHTELMYEKKGIGFKFETPVQGTVYKYDATRSEFYYLKIPLLLRATFGKKIKYFGNIGTYFGFLQSMNEIVFLNLENANFDRIFRVHSDFSYETFDYGIASGFGFAFPIDTRIDLSFELRNNYGLSNLNQNNKIYTNTLYTNSTLGIFGLSYKIGMNNK